MHGKTTKQLSPRTENMLRAIIRNFQYNLFLLLSYMADTNTLDSLAAKIDERQKLIDDLATGMKKTEDLLNELQVSSKKLDEKFAALTQQIANDSTVKDLAAQVTSKNSQLSGLVQKLNATVTNVPIKS